MYLININGNPEGEAADLFCWLSQNLNTHLLKLGVVEGTMSEANEIESAKLDKLISRTAMAGF
jgi:hypothetical protein